MDELTEIMRLYNPKLRAMTEENGFVIIELTEPFGTGTIRSIQVCEGIQLGFSDFRMKEKSYDNHQFKKTSIEINYCLEGKVEGRLKSGRRFSFNSDDFGCYPSGKIDYVSMCNMRFQGINILLTVDEAMDSIIEHIGLEKNVVSNFFERILNDTSFTIKMANKRLSHIFKEIYVLPNKFYKIQLRLKVMELMLCLISDSGYNDDVKFYLPTTLEEKMVFVHDWLMEDVSRKTTIKEIANMIAVNQTDLMKGFKSIYGDTIHTHLVKARMCKAKELLLTTEMKVSEVAEKVGYVNASKFANTFKKQYHMTPNQFRKMHQ